jgi:hypothetical protein
METIVIQLQYDDDAQVWYSYSDDLPGLRLCGPSIDALMAESEVAARELLEFNHQSEHAVRLTCRAERTTIAA